MDTWTVNDAIDMLRRSGVAASDELTNIHAAYADITDEIETLDGVADFDVDEFAAALRQEAARAAQSA